MDPLEEALIKHYGMTPDLAGRVAQNLRTPGPHPGYEKALQDVAAQQPPEQPPVVQSSPGRSYREAQTGQVAVTSAAIAQQFGVPPSGAVELAEKLHGMSAVPQGVATGLEQSDPNFDQIKSQRLYGWAQHSNPYTHGQGTFTVPDYDPEGLPPRPPPVGLEVGHATVQPANPPVSLEVGPVSFEVPKGKADPNRLQQLASAYWTHNKDPYISTYWSKPENTGARDETKAQFLAELKALRASNPAAAKRAVALGFKASQDSYRQQQAKRDRSKH